MVQKDYLTELLQNMQGQMNSLNLKQDEQSRTLDKIHYQTRKTNGRVDLLEAELKPLAKQMAEVQDEVFPKIKNVKQLPPFWKDPQIIKLLTYIIIALIILLSIIAGLKGINIPGSLL